MKKVTFAGKPSQKNKEPANADQWIEMANQPPAGEPMKRFTIDVPLSLHQRIKYTCALQGFKMADVIRSMLIERFPEEKKDE